MWWPVLKPDVVKVTVPPLLKTGGSLIAPDKRHPFLLVYLTVNRVMTVPESCFPKVNLAFIVFFALEK